MFFLSLLLCSFLPCVLYSLSFPSSVYISPLSSPLFKYLWCTNSIISDKFKYSKQYNYSQKYMELLLTLFGDSCISVGNSFHQQTSFPLASNFPPSIKNPRPSSHAQTTAPTPLWRHSGPQLLTRKQRNSKMEMQSTIHAGINFSPTTSNSLWCKESHPKISQNLKLQIVAASVQNALLPPASSTLTKQPQLLLEQEG